MIVKLLTEHNLEFLSLKGCCTGLSESTLVKMTLCWKSCVMAQICSFISVFTQPKLEKVPDLQVPSQDIYRVPKPGTVDWSNASDDHVTLFESTMDRLRQRSDQRRVLAKPVFQDFDRQVSSFLNSGIFLRFGGMGPGAIGFILYV